MQLQVIAHAHNGFSQKFGIPRQSRENSCIETHIIFTHAYRVREALRGIEEYSHLWLIWGFHEAVSGQAEGEGVGWNPTVRPPRLGGNKRMGVFAMRSPFRPNSIGLSSLNLEKVELTSDRGPVLHVSGADILDGTPIFDIKPYIAFTDSHPDAVCGFSEGYKEYKLKVEFEDGLLEKIDPELQEPIIDLLACDPRPSYQNDPTRVYGLDVSGYSIKFTVNGETLTVVSVTR
jgi:tRNA-Thr(GGU) m(6)t(6)A37 methyltransferase TsaA